jgi:hypothetical protein
MTLAKWLKLNSVTDVDTLVSCLSTKTFIRQNYMLFPQLNSKCLGVSGIDDIFRRRLGEDYQLLQEDNQLSLVFDIHLRLTEMRSLVER